MNITSKFAATAVLAIALSGCAKAPEEVTSELPEGYKLTKLSNNDPFLMSLEDGVYHLQTPVKGQESCILLKGFRGLALDCQPAQP